MCYAKFFVNLGKDKGVKMMKPNEVGQKLLAWNRQHLVANRELTIEMISECFHSELTVVANGRHYETDHAGYLQFLNGFRQTIASINYEVSHEVTEGNKTVLCMRAKVLRLDGSLDQFEAMLLLEFNEKQKITLWHEVYVEVNKSV